MATRTQILFATAVASVGAVLTALLLLNGSVSVAVWLEGPYFPLTLLLPGNVDTLATMVVVVAAYYFVSSLVALRYASRRTVALVVLFVIAVNTLGEFVWHRLADRSASADGQTALSAYASDVTPLSSALRAPSAAAPAAADTRDVGPGIGESWRSVQPIVKTLTRIRPHETIIQTLTWRLRRASDLRLVVWARRPRT